jgi:hypothetical protein
VPFAQHAAACFVLTKLPLIQLDNTLVDLSRHATRLSPLADALRAFMRRRGHLFLLSDDGRQAAALAGAEEFLRYKRSILQVLLFVYFCTPPRPAASEASCGCA